MDRHNQPLYSRRQFCSSLAAVAVAPALAAAGAKPSRPLKYLLASSLYGTMKLAEILPHVEKTRSLGIDLWPAPHANQREQADAMGRQALESLLDRHGVRLAMTTRYDLGPLGLASEIGYLKHFGGELIVTGSIGPKNVAGREAAQAVRQFVEQMKPTIALAEAAGIKIGIENHANALVASVDSIRYLAEYSPSPNLGIALAPYHLPQDVAVLAGLIEEIGPRLTHFYAWQYGRGCQKPMPKQEELEQMPGRGPLDFGPMVAALGKANYQGYTQVFMHPTPRGIPILPTAEEVTAEVNRAIGYLDNLQA